MDTAAHSMCCRLSREPAQVRHARKQTREALSRWGLDEHADLAELIVSELATNAIRHGDGVVHVCVSFARGDLRVEVHDDAAGRWPVRQQAAAEDESGRGLALLDGLIGLHGGRRGVAYDSTGHRKTVYVMICLAAEPAGPVTGASAVCAPTAHRHHAGKPPGPSPPPARCGVLSSPQASDVPARAACCPGADAPDRQAARAIACCPEQGWSLLRNGVVVFEDSGALLPDGTIIEPHYAASRSSADCLLPNQARPRGAPCRTDARVRGGRTGLRPRPGPARPSPVRALPPACELQQIQFHKKHGHNRPLFAVLD
jgi:anti-sigma regulatory factor (Ser/Thr protein kinase)